MKQISYLLATNKPYSCASVNINIIKSLGTNYELIIVSSDKSFAKHEDANTKFDFEEGTSSVQAYNQAYSKSQGDWIVIVTDDLILPLDFKRIYDYFESDAVMKQKIKIGNLTKHMGGPGHDIWFKNTQTYNEDNNDSVVHWSLSDYFPNNIGKPFHIVHVPVLKRESIINYLDNVIFNESFTHHHCDAWLGYYTEQINSSPPSWPKDLWVNVNNQFNNLNTNNSSEPYGKDIMLKLVLAFSQKINYNHRIDNV